MGKIMHKGVNYTGGSGATSLSSLNDVALSSPINGQVLKYDATSGKWVAGSSVDESEVADAVKFGQYNIQFGIDSQGNYGYIKAGADTVTPFKNPTGNTSLGTITVNGTYTGYDVEDYASASIEVDVPIPYEEVQTEHGITLIIG